jgi:thioredoxin-like negative regulator of GroEL
VLTAALQKGVTGINPSDIEALYREVLQSSPDKVGLALKLAHLYALQANESQNAVNYFLYAAERDATGQAKTELVDFLKSLGENPSANPADAYAKAMNSFPNDVELMGAYAEFLSWTEATRPQALEQFLKLAQLNPRLASQYAPKVEETLVWHQAKRAYLSWYEQLGHAYPSIHAHQLAMARAYWKDKTATPNFEKAYGLYNELFSVYGEDAQFISEFSGLLSQSPDRKMKERGLALVEGLYRKHPEDAALILAYAKQLSYAGKHTQAIKLFDQVLSQSPHAKDALLGKANAYLWSGSNLEAIKLLTPLRQEFPNNVEVLKALAQAYKGIGRYDKALQMLDASKNLSTGAGTTFPVGEVAPRDFSTQAVPEQPISSPSRAPRPEALIDLPPMLEDEAPLENGVYPLVVWEEDSALESPAPSRQSFASHASYQASYPSRVPEGGDGDLEATLQRLHHVQNQSNQSLERLQSKVNVLTDLAPGQAEVSGIDTHASKLPQYSGFVTTAPAKATGRSFLGESTESNVGFAQHIISDEDPAVGNHVGGRGDLFHLDELAGLNQDIRDAMRPSIRTGFLYTNQDGDDTTNKLRHWIVPNQLSFQLTPNVRMRAGYALRKFYIPQLGNGVDLSPRSTMAHQYSLGTTFGITDKLSFDGDASLENYTQSSSVNVNYQARLQYQATDRLKLQFGSRRSPLETSLLSYAGFKPNNGNLAGQLVGQVRETSIFGEVNMGPWKHFDLNMGYEFAWVNGENVPSNSKNQAYASLGYNWQYTKNHALRLAYESLFFGYAKNATFGYYNQYTTNPQLVLTQNPLVASPAGYVLGGYFSPDTFFLNDIRADLRGSFFDKFLEYKIGGSVGVQNYNPGISGQPNVTGAAYSANGQLTANLTDAISIYGVVDYLDTGGIFSRWRLGGGLIYRPAIRGMMPLIGQK